MSDAADLGHPVFDADNHYYEAVDAFTRHLDPALGPRVVQWCEIDGRRYHVLGGRVSRAVTNPTFDPIALPGAMYDYFRGNAEGRSPLEMLSGREPIRAAYREPAAREATLDALGLAGCLLFPTLGMIYEAPLASDPGAVCHLFRAFNRWLVEDWTCNYHDRIFAAPYLTLADPVWAVEELTWALDQGARIVVMRPAAPTTALGRRSPFDTMFDGFWRLADDAGITVVVHAADSGVSSNGYAEDGFAATFSGGGSPRSSRSPSSRPSATTCCRSSSRTTSTASPTCGSPRSKTVHSSSRISWPSCARPPTRCPGTGRTTRSTRYVVTSGSTHSGKTTSPSSPSAWGPTASSSAPTGPTSKGFPSRSTMCSSSRDSTRTTPGGSSSTTSRHCSLSVRPPDLFGGTRNRALNGRRNADHADRVFAPIGAGVTRGSPKICFRVMSR